MWRAALTGLCSCAALASAALWPAGAGATVTTCDNVGGSLTVAFDATTSQLSLIRSGSSIQVFDGAPSGSPVTCLGAAATVNNVDSISVSDLPPSHSSTVLVSLQGGPFAPGLTPEPAGSEIEIAVNGGGSSADLLAVDGTDSADVLRFGQLGAGAIRGNLNPDQESGGPDYDDVSTTGVEQLLANGRPGGDELNASGDPARGLGAADPDRLTLQGGNDRDTLRGGPGADILQGGVFDDTLLGGAGDDSLDGGEGDDKLDGGTGADSVEGGNGVDRAVYDTRGTPVTASVGNGARDDGGAEDQSGPARDNLGPTVESVTGGAANDLLIGSPLGNNLVGGLGADLMLGMAGNDDLDGGAGRDAINGGLGVDHILGGGRNDKLIGGGGRDFMRGGRGRDLFKGQGGNDRLTARDGARDRKIDCGKGRNRRERAVIDESDPQPRSC